MTRQTSYLLHGRREPQKDGPPIPQTLRLRHYLFMVHTKKHRDALTSVLLSTHQLAVEVLRWSDHAHPREPDRARRVCRFCKTETETPEHALLSCCSSVELVLLRESFMVHLFNYAPRLRHFMVELNTIEFLKAMIYERSSIALVAKFVHDVLQIFYATPIFRLAA